MELSLQRQLQHIALIVGQDSTAASECCHVFNATSPDTIWIRCCNMVFSKSTSLKVCPKLDEVQHAGMPACMSACMTACMCLASWPLQAKCTG